MANEENKKKEAEEQNRENRTEQAKEDFDIPDEDLDRELLLMTLKGLVLNGKLQR